MTIAKEVTPYDSTPGAPEVPYYTPQQPIPAGTFIESNDDPNAPAPAIFTPLKIGPMTIQNRIGVSPMCQYSADNFHATRFHEIHYGAMVTRGPGITIVEATAVSREGVLSPHDLGIWTDLHAESLKPIVDYAHSQGQKIAVQLGHGGRKANGQPIFLHLEQYADESVGGLPPKDIVAPSAIPYRPYGNLVTPRELSTKDIHRIIADFGSAAKRAVEISGFDALEIHGAHGYLITEFLSPVSNKRTDEYGGSFENRVRFLSEIIDAIKSQIDTSRIPLFVRFSAVENSVDPEGWDIEDSKKLADILIEKGISLIDVSSGGNDYRQKSRAELSKSQREPMHVPFARELKKHVGDKIVVACVGQLEDKPEIDNKYIEDGVFDLALVGRGFLREPGLVWQFADKLNVRVAQSLQYSWGFWPNRKQITDLIERSERELAKEKKQQN